MLKKQGPRVNHNRRNQNSRTKSQSQPKEPKLKDQESITTEGTKTQGPRIMSQLNYDRDSRIQDQDSNQKNHGTKTPGPRSMSQDQKPRLEGPRFKIQNN